MSVQKQNIRTITLILMMLIAMAFRLLSFKFPYILSNFNPIGAIAVFGGVYFKDKWKAYAVILILLIASDIPINYFYTGVWMIWSSSTLVNCICFSIVVLTGTLIKKLNAISVFTVIFAPVLIHWLITDLPWLLGDLYPYNFSGYLESLNNSITFELNMLYGDIVFGLLLFGGFELAKNKYAILCSSERLAV